MTWAGQSRWRRAPGLLETRVADRLTVLAPGEECPFVLAGTAGIVVDLLAGRTLDEVVAAITQAYDVERAQAQADVQHVVTLLADRGVLVTEAEGLS